MNNIAIASRNERPECVRNAIFQPRIPYMICCENVVVKYPATMPDIVLLKDTAPKKRPLDVTGKTGE